MPVYQFECNCGCKGIITTNYEVEYFICPYCHKTIDKEQIPQATNLNNYKR